MTEIRTTIDFGLVVLIWLVQLIIYPSFKHVAPDAFVSWHTKYSMLISLIVVPLMFGQVAAVGYQLVYTPHWAAWVSAGLVALAWISTFFQAVPLHNLLGAGQDISTHIVRLIEVNWNRTFLWSLVFVLGLVQRFYSG